MIRKYIPFLLLAVPAAAQHYTNPLAIPPVLNGPVYNLTANDTTAVFYPNITTSTFAYNGTYLGPTLLMHKGDSVQINIHNQLPEPTTVHWHGMHVPSVADGGPHLPIAAGDSTTVGFRVMNDASTCWYHPHIHMNTMPQVNMGLAGFIYVYDTVEAALNLPRSYGVDDIPVVLQDRTFGAGGDFVTYALADTMIVNGTANPYLDCPAQVIRLRLLNGSNARNYNIGFSDNRNFHVIASDGGLLAQPFTTSRLVISSGERYEILIDMTGDNPGDSLYLMSYGSAFANNEPGGGGMPNGTRVLNAIDFNIMQLNVVSQTSNPVITIPASLVNSTPWNTANAVRTRNKTLAGMGMFDMGNFTIGGLTYDMLIINDTIYKDDIEIWHISNTSNVAHPFHIHDVPFYVTARNGNTPPAYERGLKDVIYLKPNENVDLIMKFADFTNDTLPYVYHCHNLAHEDMGMMLQFIVIEQPSGISVTASQPQTILAYPNPAANEWTILIPDNKEEFNWSLYDETGKLVDSGKGNGTDRFAVDASVYSPGMYHLVVRMSGRVETINLLQSGN